jgi:hypothetical protein
VVIYKEMALQMTRRNTLRFDQEKSSVYKRAAQTFDLFLAPNMKDILDEVPDDARIDFSNFPVVNALPFTEQWQGALRSVGIPVPEASGAEVRQLRDHQPGADR